MLNFHYFFQENHKSLGKMADETLRDPYWAWFTLAASALIMMGVFGITRINGLLYVEFLDLYNEGVLVTGWVISVLYIGGFVSSLVGGFLVDWFTPSTITMVTSCVATMGYLMTIFFNDFIVLILGFAVVGLFEWCHFVIANVVVSRCFKYKRGLAVGILFSGGSLGSIIFPLILDAILKTDTVRKFLLMLACILLNHCVCGMAFRISEKEVLHEKRMEKIRANKVSRFQMPTHIPEAREHLGETASPGHSNTCIAFTEESISCAAEVLPNSVKDYRCKVASDPQAENHSGCKILQTIVMTNVENTRNSGNLKSRLVPITAFVVLWSTYVFSQNGFLSYFAAFAQEKGLLISDIANLMSVFGVAEFVFRVIWGFVADLPCVDRTLLPLAMGIACGACLLAMTLVSTYIGLMACIVLMGCIGLQFQTFVVFLVTEAFGSEHVGTGMGFAAGAFGGLGAIVPFAAGGLKVGTGSYDWAMVMFGISPFFGTAVYLILKKRLITKISAKFVQICFNHAVYDVSQG